MEAARKLHMYSFSQYSVVGYNSLPNTAPLLSGVDINAFADGAPPEAVWSSFKQQGYATLLTEELHDGCGDLGTSRPSAASKLFFSKLGAEAMPHHNGWQAFCLPELKQCCTDPSSFLRPGRRQCVNGADLHVELLGHARSFLDHYGGRGVPRMGMLNLMTAHEHFMTRLGTVDDDMREFMQRIERHLASDTALFLFSDHGTHGIWYNDFAVGQAEHRTPMLLLLLPPAFVKANPTVDGALRRNQGRRVTAFDLHATLQHIAEWPAMPPPSAEATSLFADLEDARSCEAARVPPEYCVEPRAACSGHNT